MVGQAVVHSSVGSFFQGLLAMLVLGSTTGTSFDNCCPGHSVASFFRGFCSLFVGFGASHFHGSRLL